MNNVMIFGKNIPLLEQVACEDSIQLRGSKILITSRQKSPSFLLDEFRGDLLYSELFKIYERMSKKHSVEVLGNLDFKIVKKIDNKEDRIAKLKGNKILVKLDAVILPKPILEYILAHEIAHVAIKRHTKRFWKTVELMCPDFRESQDLLSKYAQSFINKKSGTCLS